MLTKYTLLNAFFAVIDEKNNIYYVSMNHDSAIQMQKFYQYLNENSDKKFEITRIDTTSNIELASSTSYAANIDMKLDSKIIKGGYYE
jgi:hypothetical protein